MKEDKKFCQVYLQTMNPERAAEKAGKQNGFLALGGKTAQTCLEEMRMNVATQIRREDVVRQLARLAFGGAEDALKLALNLNDIKLETLDLTAVAEFKVTEKGVEMKLVDRVKALEGLYHLLDNSNEGGADELYRALEAVAENQEGCWNSG